MTTIYLQKSNRGKKSFKKTFFIVLVLVAIAFAVRIFWGGSVDQTALSVGGPVASGYTGIKGKLVYITAMLGSRQSLIAENKELKDRLEENMAKLLRFDSLQKENQDLISAYGRSPFATSSVLGNVISKPPQSPYDVLVVDVGSRDGVAVGDRVNGIGGVPIGRVAEVSDATSKAVLFSSFGEKNEFIIARTGASISVIGKGGGNMEAALAQELDIVEGDDITLPQFGGTVVASVAAIDATVTAASKTALLRLPTNVFHLRWVEVVKNLE